MSDKQFPLSTPLDVRRGLTDPKDTAFSLRWGILGAGNVSRQWALSLKGVPGATITAVAARDQARADAFAANLGIAHAFDSYEAMVASPEVDIVYVGTKTWLHKEHSILGLNAGKHVLCEKPLASNVTEAEEMYAVAKTQNVMLQDGMWTRFFPAVEHARTLIEDGAIGEPLMVHADFFDPIYVIQAAPLAFGIDNLPTTITTAGRAASAAVLDYEGKRAALLSFPPFNSELPEVTEIFGTQGRITLGRPGHCPTDITLHCPPAGQVPSQYRTGNVPAPVQRFHYPLPANVSIPNPFPNQHGFLYMAEAVHRCLAVGLKECPQYGDAESIHCMEILTEIMQQKAAAAAS
ncbi:MAG: Gfo/Idh/MocA family oxidoreductase [Gammaproteobacteria bacterium]|nr:Gfo/Idh/MocA family oxidoreductase [Gammaproteobacteria bacterium]